MIRFESIPPGLGAIINYHLNAILEFVEIDEIDTGPLIEAYGAEHV